MSEDDRDRKLSQLFRLKRLEVPSNEFWESFDANLYHRLALRNRAGWKDRLGEFFQRYWVRFVSLSYAACCMALVFTFTNRLQKKEGRGIRQFAPRFSAEVIPFQKRWKDVTLALEGSTSRQKQYIRDDMHIQGLKSRKKELAF